MKQPDQKLPLKRSFLSGYTTKLLAVFLAIMLPTLAIKAQTLPQASSCTSKDLELVGASLPAPANDPCACGGTRTLMLTINNKTGSTRTSFAFWGTLKITDSEGNTRTEKLFACAPSIPKSSITTLPSSKQISFNCGESIVIENLFLAWTSSSPGETCSALEANSALIAPKCGVLPSIRVLAGVSADLLATDASCSSGTGNIRVTPYGGEAPYTVSMGQTSYQVAAGASANFSGLGGGNHTINVTDKRGCTASIAKAIKSPDAISAPQSSVEQPTCSKATGNVTITNKDNTVTYQLKQGGTLKYTASNGVFSNVAPGSYQVTCFKGVCSQSGLDVTIDPQPASPAAPELCVIQPKLCGPSTGTLKVLNPTGSGIQYSKNGGETWQTSVEFPGLAAGSSPSIVVKTADGCVSSATDCSKAVVCDDPGITLNNNELNQAQKSLGSGALESTVIVKASPNPFGNNVRFTITAAESGIGSLDVYNVQGQKIKTVYQGFIPSGISYFDLNLNSNKSSQLVYILNLGKQRISGKLLQLSNK